MKTLFKLFAVVCSVMASQVFAAPIVPGPEHAALIERAKEHVSRDLKDPYSAKFEGLYIGTTYPKKQPVVCGTINAKNSYGAYIGRKMFFYKDDNKGGGFSAIVTKPDSVDADLWQTFCVEYANKYQ